MMSRPVVILGLALGLSLLGNVYLGGLVAGRDLFGGPHHAGPPPPPQPFHMRMGQTRTEGLSPEGKALVEQAWEDKRPVIREAFRNSWRSRKAVRTALTADPFDAEALKRAREEQSQRREESRAMVETVLADLAATLSAEDRAVYFARPDRPFGHRPGGFRKPGGSRDRPEDMPPQTPEDLPSP